MIRNWDLENRNAAGGRPEPKPVRDARFRRLLVALEVPAPRGSTIKVTGTNGKGSTVAMLEAALRRSGLRVGTFTSPHLFRVNERFRTDGVDVPERQLRSHAEETLAAIDRYIDRSGERELPTWFEFLLVLALRIFEEEKVDVSIFESGIGGYNDVVALLPGALSILTTIGLDHADRLGGTLPAIAADKAGIASAGARLVLGPRIPWPLRTVVERDVLPRGVALVSASTDGISARLRGLLPTRIEVEGFSFDLPLPGRHQVENLATAVAAMRALREDGLVPDLCGLLGIEATRWPGRLELVPGSPPFLLDVAHNEEGILALAAGIDELLPGSPRVLLYGAGSRKDYRGCLPHLPRIASEIFLTGGFHSAEDPRTIASQLPSGSSLAGSFATVSEALEALRQIAPGKTVLATGSVFLVGELRNLLVPTGEGGS